MKKAQKPRKPPDENLDCFTYPTVPLAFERGGLSNVDRQVCIVVFPGASLMEIRSIGDGATWFRCPGCGATMIFTATSIAVGANRAFVHDNDDCPIFVRIERALDELRAAQSSATN